MQTDGSANQYPYLQVVVLFSGFGSVVGGLIAELTVLFIFREAKFAQIGFQPLLYISLFGFLPALITAMILAYIKVRRGVNKVIRISFLIGFLVSAFYIALIVLYLGIETLLEIAVLLGFMLIGGLFGGINSIVAGYFTLPKPSKSHFDNRTKKAHDICTNNRYIDKQRTNNNG